MKVSELSAHDVEQLSILLDNTEAVQTYEITMFYIEINGIRFGHTNSIFEFFYHN